MTKWLFVPILMIIAAAAIWAACQSGSLDDAAPYNETPYGMGGGGGGGSDDDTSGDDDSASSSDDDTTSTNKRVVIIYHSSTANPLAMQNVLSDVNIDSDLVQDDNIHNVNLAIYDAMIVDTSATWPYTLDLHAAIDSGLPVLGFLYGGGYMFDQMSLPFGYFDATTYDTEYYCSVGDETLDFFTTPNKIIVDDTGRLQLYNQPSYLRTSSTLSPSEVVVFVALAEYATEQTALTFMRDKYFYWAFDGGVNSMTDDGVNLFINVMHYLVNAD